MVTLPRVIGRSVALLIVLAMGLETLPVRAQEKPPNDQRLEALEKAIQDLTKELRSLRQGPAATPAPAATASAAPAKLPDFEVNSAWLKNLSWRSIGPANMGGRITDLAVCEADPSMWWVATASGGLLKTTNNGVSIEHQFDHEATVSIGAVAVAQSNPKIVWVGTGEANPRNSVSYGDGVYRSLDGGKKWQNMGLEKTYQISRVLIHPADPNIVYVGACGRLYGASADRGVYKTTDGGATWTKLLFVDAQTGVIDMVMHPTDPNTLIAALWDRQRDGFDSWPGKEVPIPDGYDGYDPIRKWGKGGGLYKTTDGGQTWRKLSQGLPSSATGRIGIDWYRKDPSILYAIIDCENTAKGPRPLPVYLGASGGDVDGKAKLTQIVPGSPAEKAGLAVGDVVVSVGEKQVTGFDQVLDELRAKKVRDKLTIHITRGPENKEQKSVEVTLAARPGQGGSAFGGGGPGGRTSRVWLGAAGEDREGKLTMTQILPEGPAAKAGLMEQDVIVSVDGKPAEDYEKFLEDIRGREAGTKLALKVSRGSESLEINITLEERPSGFGGRGGIGGQPTSDVYMGIQGDSAPDGGAILTQISEDGPAQKAMLEEGDVVQTVDGMKIADYEAFTALLRTHKAGDKLKLTILRGAETKEVEVTLEPRPGGPSLTRPYAFSYGGQSPNIQDQQGANGHEYGGVYRSRDGGESWERVNSLNSRPMYFSVVKVDPSDANRVYVLGVSQYQSSNGGITFNADFGRGVHADGHALWIDPRDGRHMILGTDGGFYVSYDRGRNWDHINTTAIGQFYHVAISPKAPYWVVGGLQDNGSWGGPAISKNGGTLNEDWLNVAGGDGFVCRVDPSDPDLMYYETQNGNIGRRHLKTGERTAIRPPARPRGAPPYRFNWNTPFMLSNHNSKVFYSAGNYVFRSLDRGNNLETISPEITLTKRGSATALAESPKSANVLYAGTDDGALWVTRDGGREWQNITANLGIPAPRWVSTIEASRHAEGRVYVCLDAHRSNDDEPYLFVSDDYGATFRSIRSNLPWGSTRCLREDREREDLLYAGTEFALWVSLDRGAHWTKLNGNLPTVAIHEIACHPASGEIVVATHGRSLWACDVSPLRHLKTEHVKDQVALHKPLDLIRWQSEPDRGKTNRRFTGTNPTRSAAIWFSIPQKAQRVTLRIEDIEGQVVRELRGPTEPGLHRITWDLSRVLPDRRDGQGGRGERGRPGGSTPPGTAPPATTPPAATPGSAAQPGATGQPPAARQPGGSGRGSGQGGGSVSIASNGTYRVVLIVDGRELPPQTVSVQRDPTAPANVVAEEVVEEALLAEQRAASEKALSRLQGRGIQDDD